MEHVFPKAFEALLLILWMAGDGKYFNLLLKNKRRDGEKPRAFLWESRGGGNRNC